MPACRSADPGSIERRVANLVIWAAAAGMIAPPAALAQREPPAADAAPRARSTGPEPVGACPDCGTVLSIERRERPRWSSIVGTQAAHGVVPQPLGPRAEAAARATARDAARAADAPAGLSEPPVERAAAAQENAGSAGNADGIRGGVRDASAEAERPAEPQAGLSPPGAAAQAPDEPRRRVLRGDDDLPRRLGWQVVVRMDDGSTRTAHLDSAPALRVGDRVRMAGARTQPR